ncbi:MAG: hypothetical protein KDE62_17355, partial [Calditrichaeota bacterium]|nr:hypothetical protein [Calditrichota bacterium]
LKGPARRKAAASGKKSKAAPTKSGKKTAGKTVTAAKEKTAKSKIALEKKKRPGNPKKDDGKRKD